MKTQAQLVESIQRFQESFWNRQSGCRPPVGIYDESIALPIDFLRRPFTQRVVTPEMVAEDLVETEYEHCFASPSVLCDDYMAFSAPWRGVPWLEAMCGCPVRFAEGSLAPGHIASSPGELAELPLPAPNNWLETMRRETTRIAAQAPSDCWVSPSILRGTSDALAALRGMTEFFIDLHDDPHAVQMAAGRINEVLTAAIDAHYEIVQPKLGGFGHLFGHWAPDKTFMLQEDALGMCAPSIYREIFMPLNIAVVKRLGACVFFHFHSTGHRHCKDVLDIPEIAGLQMSMESVGPTMLDMIPVFRDILERGRLMLQVCTGFELLPEVLRKIPHEGLYLIIPSKYIPTDNAFREFVAANFER